MNPANRVPEPRWPLTNNRPALPPLVHPGPRIDPATLAVWVAVAAVPFGSVVVGVAASADLAAEMLAGRDGTIVPFYVNEMPGNRGAVYGRPPAAPVCKCGATIVGGTCTRRFIEEGAGRLCGAGPCQQAGECWHVTEGRRPCTTADPEQERWCPATAWRPAADGHGGELAAPCEKALGVDGRPHPGLHRTAYGVEFSADGDQVAAR